MISPYTSIQDVVKGIVGFLGNVVKNQFDNLKRMKNVTCPILIIHGKKDNLIHYEQAQLLINNSEMSTVKQLFISDEMTHNYFN